MAAAIEGWKRINRACINYFERLKCILATLGDLSTVKYPTACNMFFFSLSLSVVYNVPQKVILSIIPNQCEETQSIHLETHMSSAFIWVYSLKDYLFVAISYFILKNN